MLSIIVGKVIIVHIAATIRTRGSRRGKAGQEQGLREARINASLFMRSRGSGRV